MKNITNMTFKNVLKFFSVLILAILVGCEDIDESNPSTGNVNDINTPELFIETIYGALRRDRVFNAQGYPFIWGDVGVDIYGSANNDSGNRYLNDFQVSDPEIFAMWQDHYFSINDVNRVIEIVSDIKVEENARVENGEDFASVIRSLNNDTSLSIDEIAFDVIAQARFVRAILNFNLVKAFENPVLVMDNGTFISDVNDLPTNIIEGLPNSNPTEMYAAIINDLVFAEENLLTQNGTFKRASVLAAKGILGKVYIQAAGFMRNNIYPEFSVVNPKTNASLDDNALYALAEENFDAVIQSGNYSLMSNYGDLFDPAFDGSNTEMIFQVSFESNGVNTGSRFGDFIGAVGGTPNGGGRPVNSQFEFISSYFDHYLTLQNPLGAPVDCNGNGIIEYFLAGSGQTVPIRDPITGVLIEDPVLAAAIVNDLARDPFTGDLPDPLLTVVPESFNVRESIAGLAYVNFNRLNGRGQTLYPLPVSDQRFLVNFSTFNVTDINNTNDITSARINQAGGQFSPQKYRKTLPQTTSALTNDQEFDFPYLRYADILLLKAEALAAQNKNLAEAIELLNMVRRRAYGIDPNQADGVTSGDINQLNAINNLHVLNFVPPYIGVDDTNGELIAVVTPEIDAKINTMDVIIENPDFPGTSTEQFITVPIRTELSGRPDFSRRVHRFGNSLEFFTTDDDGNVVPRRGTPTPVQNLGIVLLNDDLTEIVSGTNDRLARIPTIIPQPGLRIDIGLSDLVEDNALLKAIMVERKKELCFEGHRRDDLTRNGLNVLNDVISNRTDPVSAYSTPRQQYLTNADEDLFGVSSPGTPGRFPSDAFQIFNYRLPIPQEEFNRNTLIRQNTGYPGGQ